MHKLTTAWNNLTKKLVNLDGYRFIQDLVSEVDSIVRSSISKEQELYIYYIYEKVGIEGNVYNYSVVCAPDAKKALKMHCNKAMEKENLNIEMIGIANFSEPKIVLGHFIRNR